MKSINCSIRTLNYLFDCVLAEAPESRVKPEVFPAREERVERVELRAVTDVPASLRQLRLYVETAHGRSPGCRFGVT